MFSVGCDPWVEGSIHICVMVVGEHGGDEVGGVVPWDEVQFGIALFLFDQGW
jgi:hypothetical protein